jgi:D-arabinose 1-dehydrogenase-like Zn-dependent alcohol dehydrogenase
MKAVVVERPHEVRYREVEAPAVGTDDVLVESRQAGLCRTDIEMVRLMDDRSGIVAKIVLEHETA